MKKHKLGGISSRLVSIPGIAAFFGLSVIASVMGHSLIAGFCFFIFLLCALSRMWGVVSIYKVFAAVEADATRMFIGESSVVSFCIRNDKPLPLTWLELLLPMPRRACFMPDGDFEESSVDLHEKEDWEYGPALRKRFSFVMGGECLLWSGKWTAKRRGVYRIDSLVLRSGDGLGLTQSQNVSNPAQTPVFVVYPMIRPVDITHFLLMQWDAAGGNRGFMEDLTIIRGLRKYEAGDSWKRINWRIAARGHELSTNIYETVTPKAVHFILDGESFCNPQEDDSEFEDALSLLASLILRLTEAHVLCGLSLPGSKYLPQTDFAATSEAGQLLTALAGYDLLYRLVTDEQEPARRDVFSPSVFDIRSLIGASNRSGRIYYVARDAAGLRLSGLATRLDASRLTLLAYGENPEEDPYLPDIKQLNLRSLGV